MMTKTEERMMPETASGVAFWEHLHRYQFAANYVKNKIVLDIASGEGYGAAAMVAAGASKVIAIDVNNEIVMHARNKYGIDARVGFAECIPVLDSSIDVVVSFETIEHLQNPALFIQECSRILRHDGMLIISTPNRDIYSSNGHHNEYHCSEMNKEELMTLLSKSFKQVELYIQIPTKAHWYGKNAFIVNDSIWNKLKGIRKLIYYFKLRYWKHVFCDSLLEYRNKTAEYILQKRTMINLLLNPFSIRKKSLIEEEYPLYYLAIAKK